MHSTSRTNQRQITICGTRKCPCIHNTYIKFPVYKLFKAPCVHLACPPLQMASDVGEIREETRRVRIFEFDAFQLTKKCSVNKH